MLARSMELKQVIWGEKTWSPKLLANTTVYVCNNGIRFTKKFIPQLCVFHFRCNFEENSLHFGSFSHGFTLTHKTVPETLPKCSELS